MISYRFIEYDKDIYIVVGIGYIYNSNEECYVAVLLRDTIFKSSLNTISFNIPFSEAEEISDKNRLRTLVLLYGR